MTKETYIHDKRDLHMRQKTPTYIAKEAYYTYIHTSTAYLARVHKEGQKQGYNHGDRTIIALVRYHEDPSPVLKL